MDLFRSAAIQQSYPQLSEGAAAQPCLGLRCLSVDYTFIRVPLARAFGHLFHWFSLCAALADGLAVFLTGLMAREMGGSRRLGLFGL